MNDYPTISVGPRDRGRSYGVLAHGLSAEDFARFRPVLEDFSLALAAWADLGLQRFVALTPLDPARSAYLLWRARFLGTGELGTIAAAHGLLISAAAVEAIAGRAHRLLSALPEPDGSPFGGAVLTATPTPPSAEPLAAFGLEWRDQVVEILDNADPEAVLVGVLEGLSPAAQIARIDGWASTGALQTSGGFDPVEAFRLIVRPRDEVQGAGLSGRTTVQVQNGQVTGESDSAPPVWRLWQAINRASGTAQAAGSDWKPGWLSLPPDRVATLALLQKAAPLGLEDRLALIAAAVTEAGGQADLAATMQTAGGEALLRLAASAERGEDAVHYLEAGLTQARFGEGVGRTIARAAPLDATLFAVSKAGLNAALQLGLIERMAGPEGAGAMAALPSEALMMMLGESLRLAETTPAMRGLAVGLVRRLAQGESLSRRYAAAGVSALVEMPVRVQDTGLATPAIAALVQAFPGIDRSAYAAHALRPLLRGETRLARPDFIDAMRAMTRLLEPAA